MSTDQASSRAATLAAASRKLVGVMTPTPLVWAATAGAGAGALQACGGYGVGVGERQHGRMRRSADDL